MADEAEHRRMHRGGERIGAERVEGRPAERWPLHGELQRLALQLDHGIPCVVAELRAALAGIPVPRAWLPAAGILLPRLSGPALRLTTRASPVTVLVAGDPTAGGCAPGPP